MKKYNILVTGVGAIIGYGIINSIRKSKYDVTIFGMDIYDDAVGKHFCDKFFQAIPASDSEYVTFLKNLISEHEIDLVFFGTEQEIYKVSASKDEFGKLLDKLVLNNSEVLEFSQDKWKTYSYLIKNNMGKYAIPSKIDASYEELVRELGSPFLIKLRHSYASKGMEIIAEKEEFNFYRKRAGENFMAQRLIGDKNHEYTAAVFGYGDGNCSKSIIFKRKLSQEGATSKAIVEFNQKIADAVEEMVSLLKPVGPTNFQFRTDEDNIFLLEVNPRISSSTSIREKFGYNESKMCIEYYLEHKLPIIDSIKSGIAIRFIDELVIYQ